MTRKDYVLIAAAIVATQDRIKADPTIHSVNTRDDQLRGVRRTAAHLCDALAKDHPPRHDGTGGFRPDVFLKACGYGGTTMNPRDPALDLRPLPGEQA